MRFVATGFLLLLASSASATVRNVPADYATIQAALNASTSGDEVLVAAGTYNELLSVNPGQDGVLLHSVSGAAATIIDGGRLGVVLIVNSVGPTMVIEGFTLTNGGHNPVIPSDDGGGIRCNSASPTIRNNIIRDNFGDEGGGINVGLGSPVIRNNEISGNSAQYGGGIFLRQATGTDIENNLVSRNTSSSDGGGIYLVLSHATIANNQFLQNNASGDGGAISGHDSSPLIKGNELRGNTAVFTGGAVHHFRCGGSIEDNMIVSNSGGLTGAVYVTETSSASILRNLVLDNECLHGSGGGVYVDQGSTSRVEGNRILRNHCVAWGGGLAIWASSTPLVLSNTIALNSGDLGGGGILVRDAQPTIRRTIVSHSVNGGVLMEGASSIVFECDDVWGNAAYDFSGVPNPTGSAGNISKDPLYCNLAALNVHLDSTSPCTALNSPSGCDLIGALDVGCGATPGVRQTWGKIKAGYR